MQACLYIGKITALLEKKNIPYTVNCQNELFSVKLKW